LKFILFVEKTKADSADTTEAASMRPQLPPLQIPKFRGLLWEWDQFWGIFSAAVHSRRISKIEKFHYLLDSLQGPAREAVQDLQITEENYDLAVDLLSSLSDQRRLLDKIVPLVSQPKQKGESAETQHMRRAILGKFTDKIQRAVLKRRDTSDNQGPPTKFARLFRNRGRDPPRQGMLRYSSEKGTRKQGATATIEELSSFFSQSARGANPESEEFPCFYCHRTDHTPTTCTQYPTCARRINQMQQRNLCRNCGSTAHKTSDCTDEHAANAIRKDITRRFAGRLRKSKE
uniref:CCHC-type domain-containing protein n=1 Tax=Heligmosomoides polygyrus TaxID=6339 RepID=A0A183FYY9_HELPZ